MGGERMSLLVSFEGERKRKEKEEEKREK